MKKTCFFFKKLGFMCTLFALLSMVMYTPVMANSPRRDIRVESYIYNRVGRPDDALGPVHAPLPYRFYRSVSARDMGLESLSHINDFKYHDGQFFITQGNTLIITDDNFYAHTILNSIIYEGVSQTFTTIEGVFVTHTGEIYLAEPAAGRLIHLDADLNLVRILGHPEGLLIPGDLPYQPQQVAVDQNGRIFVISGNVLEGLVEINPDGTFNRFFGQIEVTFTAAELFWRQLQTRAQRQRSLLWLPTTFTNLTIDHNGFVFATLSDGQLGESVRQLNARGGNLLRRPDNTPVVGDMDFITFGWGMPLGPSTISQVEVTEFGVYYVFDRTRNRVFAYDIDGHLLFAFGGSGSREGLTQNVVGMALSGDWIVLADRQTHTLEVFERTSYGHAIITAARHQYHANYMAAAEYWRQVLDYNPYFQYANLGIGRALYRNGYFREAQQYFLRAQNVPYYSRAFQQVRADFLEANFNAIGIGIGVIIVLYICVKIAKRFQLVSRFKNKRGEVVYD